MKKLLLSLVVTAFLAAPALAQTEQNEKDMKKDHAAWDKKVKDELNLTEEQTVKYDALSKQYADKIEALKQDATLSANEQKQKKMDLKKEKETRLQEFLTAEQLAKYRELTDKKKKDMAVKPTS